MRTTLAIDDDVLAAARQLANREQRTLGEVISSLARRGLPDDVWCERNGILLLPVRRSAQAATLKLVNQLRDGQA
ncbi:MAG TPA: CopG family transcriptional regulator [Ideonella sp.]|uniref:CopG family transcriptional regulator n=1 Tax=Ideonella sp. TaxID=1929293 RepID=UPI002CF8C8A6|nr:CopG family transcriptional regulator [Ideonella sp.]HSI46751.1 CopG family transcriptional regulator [Ideonella sp.]